MIMRTFELILNEDARAPAPLGGGFSGLDRWLLIQGARTILMVLVLFLVIGFQFTQKHFFITTVWNPVYFALVLSFVLNGLYLLLFERLQQHHNWIHGALFTVDLFVISLLIFFTGVSQSLFVFLYLINLILGGLAFQREGGLYLAMWTSVLFSWLIILSPFAEGASLYLSVIMNNVAFFSVALVSGTLSEQLDFMQKRVVAQGADLRALKELNTLVVDNIATGLMTVDPSLRVLTANGAAQDILENSQLAGRPLGQSFAAMAELIPQQVRLPGQAYRQEVEFQDHRGQKRILEVVLSVLVDKNEEHRGYLLLFQDLTQVKYLEQKMRHQEKLAAVGQLAAGIAHEIRNPLASISGSIQLLVTSQDALTPEDQKLMAIVLREIDRLNGLISEFLEYVRPEVAMEDPVNLNEVLREALEVLKFNKSLRQDIAFEKQLKASHLILGHYDKLKQAFLNILLNAGHAVQDVARPEISVSCEDENGDYVLVKIEDNGQGIDPARISRIFEPFHTTKPKGTGLGLAITHKIFEMHEAEVTVESQLGEGTEFRIRFPTARFRKELDPQDQSIRTLTA